MNNPKITWYVLESYNEEFEYVPKKKHEEDDSIMPGEALTVKMQVWNNRHSSQDVKDATNARLILYFKNYEDNFLLKLCSIKKENDEAKPVEIDIDRGYFELGTISGKSNNGSDLNYENYFNVELKLGPLPNNIKSELKNLILDIEYDDIQE